MMAERYGGFWRRLTAFFFDTIILSFTSTSLFLIGLLALGLSGDLMERIPASPVDLDRGAGIFALLYLAASLLAGMTYFTWFHGISGRTPGKRLFGLRVIQASGSPMTPGIAFLRWVGYLISGPVLGLGFLWIAMDRRKQGWHDKIAATLVIRGNGKSNPNAEGNLTGNASEIPTLSECGAAGVQTYAGEPETFASTTEDRQEKRQADDGWPHT